MLKKTCNGCRALAEFEHPQNAYCSLFYKTEKIYDRDHQYKYLKPKEPCPKPTTWAELTSASVRRAQETG
jgi:hypothetical protein